MNLIIAAELYGRAVIISINETRTRGQGKKLQVEQTKGVQEGGIKTTGREQGQQSSSIDEGMERR